MTTDLSWEGLLDAARGIAEHAYAPYSNYPVGAAALVRRGDEPHRVVTGCNVENASYGVGLCAECGLVSQLAATGGGRIGAFVCVNGAGEIIMPCGRCRQLLNEFKAPGMRILTPRGELAFDDVLPQSFGPADLDHYAAAREEGAS